MTGLDNENITQRELTEFLYNVDNENVFCPKCGKKILKMKNLYFHEAELPDSDTYIMGVSDDSWVYAEVECDCGFNKEYNSLWCLRGIDGTNLTSYRVGLAVGGVMENPNYTYENIEIIKAYSKLEATKIYKEKFGSQYWEVRVLRIEDFETVKYEPEQPHLLGRDYSEDLPPLGKIKVPKRGEV